MPVSQSRPTPGEIRDHAHEILSRPEFGRHESLVERFFNWLGDLFNGVHFGVGGGSGFLGNLVGLAIIAGVIYLLVRLAMAFAGRTRPPKDDDTDDLTIELEEGRASSDWGSEAERFEAAGEWREAMRARYRQLVRALVEDRVLEDLPGRTTGEYRAAFVAARPGQAHAFTALTALFESVWYGGRDTDAGDNQRFRALADESRARQPVDA